VKSSAFHVKHRAGRLGKSNEGDSFSIAEAVPARETLHHLCPGFRVGFVIGRRVDLQRSEIPHFRAINVIAALETVGFRGTWCYEPDIPDRIDELLACDILVLVRGAMSEHLERIIEMAHAADIPLVFDIDDYCFTRKDHSYLTSARRYSPDQIIDYNDAADRYFKSLSQCRYFTASTTPLAGQGRKLGLKSYVLTNTLNNLWLEVTERIIDRKAHQKSPGPVTIGYFPGSCTHQHDFKQALPAILRIMDTLGEVRLLLTELLDMQDFPELKRFRSRVDIMPRVPWQHLAHEIARVDINIAPLEVDDWCQAKSELKYFQAGALAIPSIVTPTIPYQETIEHGFNGFLASGESEWYELLRMLVTDKEHRNEVGWRARTDVLGRYAPANLRDQAILAYTDILRDARNIGALPSTQHEPLGMKEREQAPMAMKRM
jgi:glycosyltransferase involved in cell wall biosynthesis